MTNDKIYFEKTSAGFTVKNSLFRFFLKKSKIVWNKNHNLYKKFVNHFKGISLISLKKKLVITKIKTSWEIYFM